MPKITCWRGLFKASRCMEILIVPSLRIGMISVFLLTNEVANVSLDIMPVMII